MAPGVRILPNSISPISRLSPSRYLALEECRLREVWSSNGAENLLPLHPNARLGIVIHRIFEEAGRGHLGHGGQTLVEKCWNEAVATLEAQMQQSWIERSLLPLAQSINNFEVQRLRTIKKAHEICSSPVVQKQQPTVAKPGFGFELRVKTPEGEVGGVIDHAFEIDEQVVLEDYKTGLVLEQNSDGEDVLKSTYVTQLQFYAALYYFTFERWPDRLQVVSTQGPPILIPVNQETSLQLIDDAKAKLRAINDTILHAVGAGDVVQRTLASPSPDACKKCLFRPNCQPYTTTKVSNPDESWPIDRIGVLKDLRTFANGYASLTLEDGADLCVIRSISPRPRHPALESANSGDRIGCFNLRRTAALNQYQETAYTTIYLM
jgi:hypothetical protein